MPVGAGFLSAFLNELVLPARLEGDPIVELDLGGSPCAGGLAFDRAYFYLI